MGLKLVKPKGATGGQSQIQGEWANHPQYDEQFKMVHYNTLGPAWEAGIQKYLGAGLIKGISPIMAKGIVKKFGLEAVIL